MGRKLLAILFLLTLGAGVFFGVRWLKQRNELEATVIFPSAATLRPGSHVVEDGVVIGRVLSIDRIAGKDAVRIHVERKYRGEVRVDSAWEIDEGVLHVRNLLAFGRPVERDEIVYAKQSRLSSFIARTGETVSPLWDDLRARAARISEDYDWARVERDLEEWKAKFPEWRSGNRQKGEEYLEAAAAYVDEAEQKLREKGKEMDARKLRERFNEWLQETRQKMNEDQ